MSVYILLGMSIVSQCSGYLEKKVVDGLRVPIHRHPHAVYLEMKREDGETSICGSSVLNQLFLVSVAHCFYGYDKDWTIIAFAGHENIEQSRYTRVGHLPIVHKNFSYMELKYDIALLLLKRRLPLGHDVKRIILTKSSPKSLTATLAGWGIVNEVTKEQTIYLQSVVQRIRKKECLVLNNEPGTFCAGSLMPSDSRPSQGDSGSGLIDKHFRLIGLLSYKVNSHPALPVYTNATYFYDWIQTQVNRLCYNSYGIHHI